MLCDAGTARSLRLPSRHSEISECSFGIGAGLSDAAHEIELCLPIAAVAALRQACFRVFSDNWRSLE
jgi:hypothetical protein